MVESNKKLSFKETVATYSKELKFALIAGGSVVFCFFLQFYSFSFLFLTFDQENESEISRARKWVFLYSIIELIGKVLNASFAWVTKRKRHYLFGISLFFIGYALVYISKLTKVIKK